MGSPPGLCRNPGQPISRCGSPWTGRNVAKSWIFAKLYDVPCKARERRVRQALAFMGLEEAAERLVRAYSGGMIRRLEVAQALLHGPHVMFLDEPTVGLDPVARKAVWDHLS